MWFKQAQGVWLKDITTRSSSFSPVGLDLWYTWILKALLSSSYCTFHHRLTSHQRPAGARSYPHAQLWQASRPALILPRMQASGEGVEETTVTAGRQQAGRNQAIKVDFFSKTVWKYHLYPSRVCLTTTSLGSKIGWHFFFFFAWDFLWFHKILGQSQRSAAQQSGVVQGLLTCLLCNTWMVWGGGDKEWSLVYGNLLIVNQD